MLILTASSVPPPLPSFPSSVFSLFLRPCSREDSHRAVWGSQGHLGKALYFGCCGWGRCIKSVGNTCFAHRRYQIQFPAKGSLVELAGKGFLHLRPGVLLPVKQTEHDGPQGRLRAFFSTKTSGRVFSLGAPAASCSTTKRTTALEPAPWEGGLPGSLRKHVKMEFSRWNSNLSPDVFKTHFSMCFGQFLCLQIEKRSVVVAAAAFIFFLSD